MNFLVTWAADSSAPMPSCCPQSSGTRYQRVCPGRISSRHTPAPRARASLKPVPPARPTASVPGSDGASVGRPLGAVVGTPAPRPGSRWTLSSRGQGLWSESLAEVRVTFA